MPTYLNPAPPEMVEFSVCADHLGGVNVENIQDFFRSQEDSVDAGQPVVFTTSPILQMDKVRLGRIKLPKAAGT